MWVFLIAAVPAAFVAWVGITRTSRLALWSAAAGATLLGIVTGNPMFMGVDLLGVAIGLYIGSIEQKRLIENARLDEIHRQQRLEPVCEPVPPRPQEPMPQPRKSDVKKSGENNEWVWVVLALAVMIGYSNWPKSQAPRPSTPPVYQAASSSMSAQPANAYQAPPISAASPAQERAGPPPKSATPQQLPKPIRTETGDRIKKERAAYKSALLRIEARHPELNPVSPAFRVDLAEQAVRLKNEYAELGLALDAALVQAVTTMEHESAFVAKPQVKPSRPMALDPGGHSGFDPKCRWVTSQDWTCK